MSETTDSSTYSDVESVTSNVGEPIVQEIGVDIIMNGTGESSSSSSTRPISTTEATAKAGSLSSGREGLRPLPNELKTRQLTKVRSAECDRNCLAVGVEHWLEVHSWLSAGVRFGVTPRIFCQGQRLQQWGFGVLTVPAFCCGSDSHPVQQNI